MARLMPIFLFFVFIIFSTSCVEAAPLRTKSDDLWLEEIEKEAIGYGISSRIVHEALDNFRPNPRVIELDRKQPEAMVTFPTYRRMNVTPMRIKKGAELMRSYAKELADIEKRTGVPPQIVIALWGVESNYGRNMGDFEVVNSLATLAYEGRRANFFRFQLFAALYVLERENMLPHELRGSWAGAMGQCQFMPVTYMNFAVDENGDGRRDIWNDPLDALASIANYLAAEGWRRNLTWGREVLAEDVDADEIGLKHSLSLKEWSIKGVTAKDGSPLPERLLRASFVQPNVEEGTGFLAYDNIRALMRWNRSIYFALSVGLLADEIKAAQDQ